MLMGLLGGGGLRARLLRSTGWTFIGFGVAQVLRLASNLVLTRLLFPEAFGLMALISVFLVGLEMLSDVGIAPSIQQSARGDDPDFLDTAWTVQAIRGGILWVMSCAIAPLVAWFYADERLLAMLPVAGLSLLISGFNPTRMETANRHLIVGRLTVLEIAAQICGLVAMLILAWTMQSIWALVIGAVSISLFRLILMHSFLPGQVNRFRLEKDAARDLIHFGKWIFLSTICGFLIAQGDKAILGKYISFQSLGIYNIGFFLAGVPQELAATVMGRIMLPLHRECPPHQSHANFSKVRKMRFMLTSAVFTMQFVTALIGIWLVGFLYDPRFAAAGVVVAVLCCVNTPLLIGMTYIYAALGRGDSRGQFWVLLCKAIVQTSLFILGMQQYGLPGALIGLWLSQVLLHPFIARLAHKHGAWDPWHDLVFAIVSVVMIVTVLTYHFDSLYILSTLK